MNRISPVCWTTAYVVGLFPGTTVMNTGCESPLTNGSVVRAGSGVVAHIPPPLPSTDPSLWFDPPPHAPNDTTTSAHAARPKNDSSVIVVPPLSRLAPPDAGVQGRAFSERGIPLHLVHAWSSIRIAGRLDHRRRKRHRPRAGARIRARRGFDRRHGAETRPPGRRLRRDSRARRARDGDS